MAKSIYLFLVFLVVEIVQPLHVSQNMQTKKPDNNENQVALRRVLESLANYKSYLTSSNIDRRSIDPAKFAKAKSVYDALQSKLGIPKQGLRTDPNNNNMPQHANHDYEVVVEKELVKSEQQGAAAILDTPYVETRADNDFLVFKPRLEDPWVTVIPNNIYYGVEKKCVNWLDDCSLQGIRARLLERVSWPNNK